MKRIIDKDTILESARLLGIEEKMSIKDIKVRYKNLMLRWHPDTCKDEKPKCAEMAHKLTDAYVIVIEYCENYSIDFTETDITIESDQEKFWQEHFGSDPLWGGQ